MSIEEGGLEGGPCTSMSSAAIVWLVHSLARRIIAASPIGGRKLMSAAIMVVILDMEHGLPPKLANRFVS